MRAPGVHKGFDYGRTNNPTRETLERVLAALEGVPHCATFSSGLAAENALYRLGLVRFAHVPARAIDAWEESRRRFPEGALRFELGRMAGS